MESRVASDSYPTRSQGHSSGCSGRASELERFVNLQATVQLSSTTGRVANSNLKLPGAGPEYRGPRSSLLVMSGAALPQCQKLEEKRIYRSLPLEVPLC